MKKKTKSKVTAYSNNNRKNRHFEWLTTRIQFFFRSCWYCWAEFICQRSKNFSMFVKINMNIYFQLVYFALNDGSNRISNEPRNWLISAKFTMKRKALFTISKNSCTNEKKNHFRQNFLLSNGNLSFCGIWLVLGKQFLMLNTSLNLKNAPHSAKWTKSIEKQKGKLFQISLLEFLI